MGALRMEPILIGRVRDAVLLTLGRRERERAGGTVCLALFLGGDAVAGLVRVPIAALAVVVVVQTEDGNLGAGGMCGGARVADGGGR